MPYREHFEKIMPFIENGDYNFANYSNGLSNIKPLPLPSQLGLQHDIEILLRDLSCSQDLILELINLANLRRDSYTAFDIIPVTLLLYETLQLNFLKVLESINTAPTSRRTEAVLSQNVENFSSTVAKCGSFIRTKNHFCCIFEKYSFISIRKVVSNIILPLNAHKIIFKSSTAFQIKEELAYFMREYNSLIVEQKQVLHRIVVSFASIPENSLDILAYIIGFCKRFGEPCFKCYDISELWACPFVFNDHILSHISSFHYPISFTSPEPFFFSVLNCVLRICTNFSRIFTDHQSIERLFGILIDITSTQAELQQSQRAWQLRPGCNALSLPASLFFCILVYGQARLDAFQLSTNQVERLSNLHIERQVTALIDGGAFLWVRRLIWENKDKLEPSTVVCLHEIVKMFTCVFSANISSWYRELTAQKYPSTVVWLRNFSLLICDVYGSNKVRHLLGEDTPLLEYFRCIDVTNRIISVPSDSNDPTQYLTFLDLILKIFAAAGHNYMLDQVFFALYGFANSHKTALIVGSLLDSDTMRSLLTSFSRNFPAHDATRLDWTFLVQLICDASLLKHDMGLKVGDYELNCSLNFYASRLASIIFKLCPTIISQVCRSDDCQLISRLVQYMVLPDNEVLKATYWKLFKTAARDVSIATQILLLLDRRDYVEPVSDITSNISLSPPYLRHSHICASLALRSKKNVNITLISFVSFIWRLLKTFSKPSASWAYKNNRVFRLYLLFLLEDAFTNIELRIFPSDYSKWRLVKSCLSVFKLIFSLFFSISGELSMLPTFEKALGFRDMTTCVGCEIYMKVCRREGAAIVILGIASQGVLTLSSVLVSHTLSSIVSDALAFLFEFLVVLVQYDKKSLPISELVLENMCYTPLSQLIGQARSSVSGKSALYDLLKILLLDNVSPKTVKNFTTVFCTCLKDNQLQESVSQALQGQTLEVQRILGRFANAWDSDVSVRLPAPKLASAYADFIVQLYESHLYDIAEIILLGCRAADGQIGDTQLLLDHLNTHPCYCIPALLCTLYRSELFYEDLPTLRVHERLLCVISTALSYATHRRSLLPALRSLHNNDFVSYGLRMLNTRLSDVRRLLDDEDKRKADAVLLLIGSVLQIASVDLYEAFVSKDFSRVEHLILFLVSNALNKTSLVVQLVRYTMLIPDVSYQEFDLSDYVDSKYLDTCVLKSITEIRPFSVDFYNSTLKLIDKNKFKRFLLLQLQTQPSNTDKVKETLTVVRRWIKDRNTKSRFSYSKCYLLESASFCFACMLRTGSGALQLLCESDRELLDVVRCSLDQIFKALPALNEPLLPLQFKILSTIMRLNSTDAFLALSLRRKSVLLLPQNLCAVLTQLVDLRCSSAFDSAASEELKKYVYSGAVYIKTTCCRLLKFSYLFDDNTGDVESPYAELLRVLINKLSSESYVSYIIDDCLTDNVDLQIVCIETALILIERGQVISDYGIIEYLSNVDFFGILVNLMSKLAPEFTSIANPLAAQSLSVIRCLELIMLCFLLTVSQHGNLHALYRANFINKLSDSNILEYSVNLINNAATNFPTRSQVEGFQRVYSPALEVLCHALQIPSSVHDEIVIQSSKLFLKHLHSFKSVFDCFVMSNELSLTGDVRPYPNPPAVRILSSTLRFVSELTAIRTRLLASRFSPSPSLPKLDPALLDAVNDLFESIVSLFEKLSSTTLCSSIAHAYLANLLSPNSKYTESSVRDTDVFDPPTLSSKTFSTFNHVSLLLFYIARIFNHYIIAYPGCERPFLSELIFLPESFCRGPRKAQLIQDLRPRFKCDSTSLSNKPSIETLLKFLNVVLQLTASVNKAFITVQRCSSSLSRSTEVFHLTMSHHSLSGYIEKLSVEKQREFSSQKLSRFKDKYASLSRVLSELIERLLLNVTVHASFFEDLFRSKLFEVKQTQLLNRSKSMLDLLHSMSTEDLRTMATYQFVKSVRDYFTPDACKKLRQFSIENELDGESFGNNLLDYLDSYFTDTD